MQDEQEQGLAEEYFSDYRVLIVEDDEIMRLSLEDRLRLDGISVCAVGDTAGARNELAKGDTDLVVSDIRLPDGTGLELFADISTYYPGTPVILMTAYGDVSDAALGRDVLRESHAERQGP